MSDIVERLRTRPTGDPYLHAMVHEAADEIERLRAEVAGLREAGKVAWAALEGLFYCGGVEGGVAVWRLGGSYAPQEAIKVLRAALVERKESYADQA